MADTISGLLSLRDQARLRLRGLLGGGRVGDTHTQSYSQTDPGLDRYMAAKETPTRGVPLEAPMFSPDDLIGSGLGKAAVAGLATLGGLLAAGRKGAAVPSKFGQSGAIVYHGSPHKFDKFDMSKIGTGEGAQAYGHGLYTAELPEVAQQYQQFGSWQHRANGQAQPVMFKDAPVQFDKMGNVVGDHPKGLKMFLSRVASKGDYDAALNEVKQTLSDMKASGSFPSIQDDLAEEIAQATANKARIKASGAQGNLYKVDIPDEAVARMLDWDKPLSQQAPEVQQSLNQMFSINRNKVLAPDMAGNEPAGNLIYNRLQELMSGGKRSDAFSNSAAHGQDVATRELQDLGIHGIRYLDQGSRSAGQGSSNFVLFDDVMPRILEINGQPTGNVPWNPGEWLKLRSLLD